MKPPICEICDKRITEKENAGLVYFQKTDADKEWDRKCKEEGFVGHPPYVEWFCEEHYPIAKKYCSLTRWEAMTAIKKEIDS